MADTINHEQLARDIASVGGSVLTEVAQPDTTPTPLTEQKQGFREREQANLSRLAEDFSNAREDMPDYIDKVTSEPFTPASVARDTVEQVKDWATGDYTMSDLGRDVANVTETFAEGAGDYARDALGLADSTVSDLGQLAQGIIASKFINSVTGATQGTVKQAVKAPVIEAANLANARYSEPDTKVSRPQSKGKAQTRAQGSQKTAPGTWEW